MFLGDDIFFVSNDKLTARDILERNPSVGTLDSLANTGIDALDCIGVLAGEHPSDTNARVCKIRILRAVNMGMSAECTRDRLDEFLFEADCYHR